MNVHILFLRADEDRISTIRYISSLRTREVVAISVSFESPTLVRLHDTLTPLQPQRHRIQVNDDGSRIDDVSRILESHDGGHDIVDHIARETKSLGISQTSVKRLYPIISI